MLDAAVMSRSHPRRGAVVWGAGFLALTACTKPRTELVVTVRSEFTSQELQGLSVLVRRGNATGTERFRATHPVGAQEPWRLPLMFALSPADEADTTAVWIEVRGYAVRDPDRYRPPLAPVVTQRAVVNYRPGERAALDLWLTRSCRDVTCDPSLRCVRANGACEAANGANDEVRPLPEGTLPVADDTGATGRTDAGMPPRADVIDDGPPFVDLGSTMDGGTSMEDVNVADSEAHETGTTDASLVDRSAEDTGRPVTGLTCMGPLRPQTCTGRQNCCAFALGLPVGCGCQVTGIGCISPGPLGCP